MEARLTTKGSGQFTKLAAELAYGKDSVPIKENRVRPLLFPSSFLPPQRQLTQQLAVTQSISGTGALRIATTFLSYHYPGPKAIYLPDPTWGAHLPVAEQAGLKVVRYRYFDKDTVGLDFKGMKEDIEKAPEGSIVLLHVCAQNPTGIDPTQEQWRELEEVVRARKHLPLFDMVSIMLERGAQREEEEKGLRNRGEGLADV